MVARPGSGLGIHNIRCSSCNLHAGDCLLSVMPVWVQVGLVHEAVRSWKKVVKVSGKKVECQEAVQLARKMLSSFETH